MAPQQETDTFSLLPTCSAALIGAACQTEDKKPDVNSSFLASELMVKVSSSIQVVFFNVNIYLFFIKTQKVPS